MNKLTFAGSILALGVYGYYTIVNKKTSSLRGRTTSAHINTNKTFNSTTIENGLRDIQQKIADFLDLDTNHQMYIDDVWTYDPHDDNKAGGGRSLVWEGHRDKEHQVLERGGVLFSNILGKQLPGAALATLPETLKGAGFQAMGVSIVIHAYNPHVPTIHMNIRYFEAGEGEDMVWWFGGGIDITPAYAQLDQVIAFHRILSDICTKHGMDYESMKKECDEYFYLPHRGEARGVGGIFFDKMRDGEKEQIWLFIQELGLSFINIYGMFLGNQNMEYTDEQREFQLWRRSRYVEFNLLFDRGTKFGIQSNGRTDSILCSMPRTCIWEYFKELEPNSEEEKVINFYCKAQDWLSM